ncbi:MAG: endonuclease MutS2 [Myxococcota bacterium]|nr:endonuclease MutS2 [Myxococcota bacterium]
MNALDQRTLETLDWQSVLLHLSKAARTERGAARALEFPLVSTREAAEALYTQVREVQLLEDEGERIPVGAIHDIEAFARRTEQGQVLEVVELAAVGRTLDALDDLRIWVLERDEDAPLLADRMQAMQLDPEMTEALVYSFDDRGQLSESTYPELGELRERIAGLHRRVQSTLEALLRDPEMAPLLQDNFVTQRSDRYVLPIKVEAKRKGLGIVHDTSKSGETVFVEPAEVVELNNRLRIAEAELERAIRRILQRLSMLLARHVEPVVEALELAVVVDLACARAELGRSLKGTMPIIGRGGVIHLLEARHPVLTLRGLDVVANDLDLNAEQRGLILSGPNTGGKTVALKTLGLAALFVRAGVPFPAKEGSRIDVFSDVIADIGDLQSVEGDLSTFSGHLLVLKEILGRAKPGTLVLLDEVAVGTDPAQGAALARAVLERVVDLGSRVGVTTHYTDLKAFAAADPRFANAAVGLEDGVPTYRVRKDAVGLSHAFSTARRMGLDAGLVDQAESFLDETQLKAGSLLEDLEDQREELDKLQRQLATKRDNLAKREKELERAKAKVERRAKALAEREAKETLERLAAAESQVKTLVAALQKNPNLRDAGKALETVRALKGKVAVPQPQRESAPPPRNLEKGDRVRVKGAGRVGTVLGPPRKGRVEVEVNGMKVRAKLTELTLLDGRPAAPKPAPKPVMTAPAVEVSSGGGVRTSRNTLDLRGKRADEALEEAEYFLDRLLRHGESVGWILHGHGTGALKQAVRRWLPRQKSAGSWRPANADEGGDAYTRVELK